MIDIDKYYQILGLNPGASEEEIKEAYRDLVNVWHPDRFSNNPRLRHKANQRMKEINMAYEKLKSCFAGETSTTSGGEAMADSLLDMNPHLDQKKNNKAKQMITSILDSAPAKTASWWSTVMAHCYHRRGTGCNPIVLFSLPNSLSTTNKNNRLYWTASAPSSSLSREQPTSTPPPTPPPTALPVVLLPQEIQKLLDLLENIRQANLKKILTS